MQTLLMERRSCVQMDDADSQKDTDGDGVTDDLDNCSDTPDGATVDANGCADCAERT